MTAADFDTRLATLKAELSEHSSIASRLGVDFERPVRSITDGYPENSVTLVGKIVERILKRIWRAQSLPGDPDGRALNDLIKGCRSLIADPNVLNALADVQRLRNRSAHDGYDIAEEDALSAVRRLLDILDWSIRSDLVAFSGEGPRLDPLVSRKIAFLAGIYGTLGYKLVKRAELSSDTIYQLFCKQSGIRAEYVEILLSQSARELAAIVSSTPDAGLLETSYPKLSRLLVLDEAFGVDHVGSSFPFDRYRIVEYERFIDTIVDIGSHLRDAGQRYPIPAENARVLPIGGRILETDGRTGEGTLRSVADALQLVRAKVQESANVLVVGRPGAGKTSLLKTIVRDAEAAESRRFRFYLDMSKKRTAETFSDFVTRELDACVNVETLRVYDLFIYLVRAGAVVCVLDGIDEAVPRTSLPAFLDLFHEISDVLSAESIVILSSRYSFLADSPSVRALLNSGDVMVEKLTQELHANGIEPSQLPRFAIVRLDDVVTGGDELETPLVRFLREVSGGWRTADGPVAGELGELIESFVRGVAGRSVDQVDQVYEALTGYLGRAYLGGQTRFTFPDIANNVGWTMFAQGRIDGSSLLMPEMFRPADGDSVLALHSVFQEYFAARLIASLAVTERASALTGGVRLTEQLRSFLARYDATPARDDGVLTPGRYLVGPSSHLVPIDVLSDVIFDRYPVTVARYRHFLEVVDAAGGCSQWDASGCPVHVSHEPWWDRYKLTREEFYGGAHDDLPVTCICFWDALAFARFEGKRLPTSSEWEAAARGPGARLFPWGDELELSSVNCADSWAGRDLVTYEGWRTELENGRLRDARPSDVRAHPGNVSHCGVRGMVGNVWELCGSTVSRQPGTAVMCGGSYDNPSKAVLASSKATYVHNGRSNVVGFRCVRDARGFNHARES